MMKAMIALMNPMPMARKDRGANRINCLIGCRGGHVVAEREDGYDQEDADQRDADDLEDELALSEDRAALMIAILQERPVREAAEKTIQRDT